MGKRNAHCRVALARNKATGVSLLRCVVFEFEVGDVVEGDAHGGSFGAALGFHGGGVVEGAAAVALVDRVHGVLQGDAARVIFFGEE